MCGGGGLISNKVSTIIHTQSGTALVCMSADSIKHLDPPCQLPDLSLWRRDPTIKIVNIAAERSEQSADVIQTFTGYSGRVNRVHFVDLNKTLISAGEDGFVRRWDVEVRSL